ncbi:MAG: ATP synthase F1 subunit gamma [Candidatus Riflebacteria bacterium]|nr:ATP synthase F1 subunit gamma [Candidatus Riflebacteria bacterium]
MANIRDVKKKIGGVKGTQQITRAMKMVATAKLRRAIERLNATKFYLEKLEDLVADLRLAAGADSKIHPLFDSRPVKNTAVVLVTGDRGLCGSFNHDLFKYTVKFMDKLPENGRHLILIGRKGHEFFRRKNIPILGYHSDLSGPADQDGVRLAARNAIKFYTTGLIDELHIVYTGYVSALERHITSRRLLPLEDHTLVSVKSVRRSCGILFDPSPEKILGSLIPRYVEGLFLRALLESAASEHGARMVAMGAATDRADEIISQLTLSYNRTRQAIITKELSEVIAGAEALAG